MKTKLLALLLGMGFWFSNSACSRKQKPETPPTSPTPIILPMPENPEPVVDSISEKKRLTKNAGYHYGKKKDAAEQLIDGEKKKKSKAKKPKDY